MVQTSVKINDSYKIQKKILGTKRINKTKFQFIFIDSVQIYVSIKYESNEENLGILEPIIEKTESDQNGDLSINISFNNTIHQGKQAIRITINLSFNYQNKSAVGSTIIKLIPSGNLIQYMKTDNISDFKTYI